MKRKHPNPDIDERIAITTAEVPDADSFVPEGMIRLTVRAYHDGENERSELLAPAGHPVYPTLIGVDHLTVTTAGDRGESETVHWATPEAVAISAEIYAGKVARGEVPNPEVRSHDPETSGPTSPSSSPADRPRPRSV